jgi:hypothetical protein
MDDKINNQTGFESRRKTITINAVFAKGISHPFTGHYGSHEWHDVSDTSCKLKHDDHQSNCHKKEIN